MSLKGDATLTFRFYEDSAGMQMYVKPPEEEPDPQEGEDVHEEDNQEKLDLETQPAEEEIEEKVEKPVNTGDPLVLTPYNRGLSTGSTLTVKFECGKDVMKSLMDAEARGLAPCFRFVVK